MLHARFLGHDHEAFLSGSGNHMKATFVITCVLVSGITLATALRAAAPDADFVGRGDAA